MSNAALCATSTVSSQKSWNAGSTRSIVGWFSSIRASIPVIRSASGDIGRARVDELLEHLMLQQPPVDDPHGADRHDLVALRKA